MKEEPKRISKRTWHVPRAVLIWLASLSLVVLGTMMIAGSEPDTRLPLTISMVGVIGATVLLCLWLFVCWALRCWRNRRRTLIGLAVFATLIAIFYNVENWRGKRAWDNCKRELEAQGELLEWNAYIPPPVPDEQNIFKAPRMQEWFVGRNITNYPGIGFSFTPEKNTSPVIVAQVTVVPVEANLDLGNADATLRFDDPAARAQAKKLIDAAVGPGANGSRDLITFVARPINQIKPLHIFVLADKVRTANDVAELFPADTIAPAVPLGHYPNHHRLQVEAAGSNSFRVTLNHSEFSTATDYLVSSDILEIDFDVIREALKRPYARMDGDYRQPFAQPIPNFVCVRSTAQLLAQRAQCYLLLGQPDKALRELTLIHDLCRLLEGKPTGKPMTLVAAMINVAITGLYLDTVADGTRLQMWREPQLAAIQGQLKQVNLTPLVMGAFESQRAAVCRTFDTSTPAELAKLLSFDASQPSLWQKIKNPIFLFFTFVPRGWVYQNMIASALLKQKFIEGFDPVRQFFRPPKLDEAGSEIQMTFSHFSPYTFLARIAVPNFTRAWQTLARNQTMANLGQIVCALERYRFAHENFPDTLDALLPQFIEKLPHDIIGGQPLKYRRTDDGRFLLYSIGWNETDDGGQVVRNKDGTGDMINGDWVWGVPLK